MCLTIPAKIKSLDKNIAEIIQGDNYKKIDISLLNNLKVGDWILYTNKFAIKKIDSTEAKEITDLLDLRPNLEIKGVSNRLIKVLEMAQLHELNLSDIEYLLKIKNKNDLEFLYSEADVIRQANLKDFFCIHGIIEFSNYCQNNCDYCGLRQGNKNIKRFRMSIKEIVGTAVSAVKKKGYKLLVLQSGEDYFYNDEKLVKIIKEIKNRCRVFIFVSIGERGKGCYEKLKEAGVSGVLFRFETANNRLFKKIHSQGKNYKNRLKHLELFKKLGYFIATGSLIGLPGQNVKDLANDILLMKKFAQMVSMGPFIPTENTPMARVKKGDWTSEEKIELNLKMIAIMRLIKKKARIPVVTALETLAGSEIRKKALSSGANSLMFNLTPAKYRPYYKIYGNKFYQKENVWEKYGLFKEVESYKMLEKRMAEELNI